MDNPNVQNTLCQLIEDRGYTRPNISDISEVFIVDNKLLVSFIQDVKLGINSVKNIETNLEEESLKDCIVIYPNTVTSFAKTALSTLETKGYQITTFTINELSFNVTKHVLVPKHILIKSREFKKQLLKQMQCKDSNLPLISINDPVAKYFGASLGDLFKIERVDENAIITPYYRLVV
uniref:RNA polymerase subunit H/Rpb5 C-terminal domain-containing protein n=1 Tax=viral metagenome TaxID=1070528 RepID=A0A6C0F6A0_9ZZZZ|tara:strand:+ start:6210 stop:6743 length:534 start_codon:yes stop_codon:yes gene_type:complete